MVIPLRDRVSKLQSEIRRHLPIGDTGQEGVDEDEVDLGILEALPDVVPVPLGVLSLLTDLVLDDSSDPRASQRMRMKNEDMGYSRHLLLFLTQPLDILGRAKDPVGEDGASKRKRSEEEGNTAPRSNSTNISDVPGNPV